MEISAFHYEGARIKSIQLTDKFDFQALKDLYGELLIPMFIITEERKLKVVTVDEEYIIKPGQTIIVMLKEPEEEKTN